MTPPVPSNPRTRAGFSARGVLATIAVLALLLTAAVAFLVPVIAKTGNVGDLVQNLRLLQGEATQLATGGPVQMDAMNINSGYSLATASALTDNLAEDTTYYLSADLTLVTAPPASPYLTRSSTVAAGSPQTVASQQLSWESGQTVSYLYSADTGKVTIQVG
jgi:Tfp pilus assembly protein FimT